MMHFTVRSLQEQVSLRRGMLVHALLLSLLFAGAFHPAAREALTFAPPLSPAFVNEQLVEARKVQIPDFAAVPDPEQRKQLFFEFMQPYVDAQNNKVRQQRVRLQSLMVQIEQGIPLARRDRVFLMSLAEEYEVEGDNFRDRDFLERLLRRVDVIPPSLVLAQAAKESGWGSSRFAKEAYNFFGQWCYEQGCGLVPSRRRANASHEVKAFGSIEEAVNAYFMNLNTFPGYLDLRLIREELRANSHPIDGLSLSEGLDSYSERGQAYIRELQSLIRHNSLLERDGKVSSPLRQD
jgi:Bax protein